MDMVVDVYVCHAANRATAAVEDGICRGNRQRHFLVGQIGK